MNHQIQKQILDVELNASESVAFGFQNRLSDWANYTLAPALEGILDSCVPREEYLYVEELVIDIDSVSLEDFEDELLGKIAQAIEKSIQEKRHQAQQGQLQSAALKSTHQRTAEAFGYFLQTGLLPWAYQVPTGQMWEEVLTKLMTDKPAVMVDIIRNALRNTQAQQRLSMQFSAVFSLKLLAEIDPYLATEVANLIQLIKNIATEQGEVGLVEPSYQQFWQLVWQYIGAGEKIDLLRIIKTILSRAQSPQQQRLLKVVKQILEEQNLSSLRTNAPKSGSDVARKVQLLTESFKKTPDEIFIQNAGLVLLHPFLPRYFEGILCAAEDQLVWFEKAALALHFLATGQSVAAEYGLPLPKILCNIPLTDSLPTSVEWSIQDTEESEALLSAVINYWPALQNSAVDLLRAEFLQRAGKLSRRSDGWLLQVERKDFDFLLAQIPWSISAVKLPWMQEMLWVEWI